MGRIRVWIAEAYIQPLNQGIICHHLRYEGDDQMMGQMDSRKFDHALLYGWDIRCHIRESVSPGTLVKWRHEDWDRLGTGTRRQARGARGRRTSKVGRATAPTGARFCRYTSGADGCARRSQ